MSEELTEPTVEDIVVSEPVPEPQLEKVVEVGGVKIERGIPIPEAIGGRKSGSKHDPVLEAMQPGDSVLFSGENCERDAGSFLRVAKKRQIDMNTRRVVENGVAGIRVWRRPV